MTTTKEIVDRTYNNFVSVAEKAQKAIEGLPKGFDKFINGTKSDYKFSHSYLTSKTDDQGCYIRIQLIETRVYIYQKLQDDINPFKEDYQKRPKIETVTVLYDHTYNKSEGCQPKRLDDPLFEDDIIPNYPDDTPDIAMFIEVNQVRSWTDYFSIFSGDYALSVKIAFKNIEIMASDHITFTAETEVNLKDKISLLPPVDDEGSFPARDVPWLINYLQSSDNQSTRKTIITNNIDYNGQKNIFKQYKGKNISAFIQEITDYNSGTTIKGYFLIGHPLIINKEMRKLLKQLTWTIETPYWRGMSEKYFVFLRELDKQRDEYYNFVVTDPHYQNDYRVMINRYNAVNTSIPLLLIRNIEDKDIKIIKIPKQPDKDKECDCMSCNDALARLILSKVNNLTQKIDQMSTPLNTLNSAIQTDSKGDKKNIFQQLWDLFFGDRNTQNEKPLTLKEIIDRINKLQDYLGEKFYEADALLDKKMTDLDDFLGKPSFPMKLQPNLLSYYDDQPPIEINTFADLFAWYISQFDSLIGEFPIKIDIKDVDPSKEGDQSKSMEFANISEILAEIMGLLTMDTVNSDILINMCTRIAAETVGAKNAALIAQDYAKANADYLGYKGNIKKREIQYSFDVSDLSRLDKLLQNSEQRIMGWENQDKNSVADYLAKLMFSAQIIKAVYFKKSADGLVNTAKNFVDKPAKDDDSEWTKFLHDINNPDSQFNINLDFPQARIKDRKDGADDQS